MPGSPTTSGHMGACDVASIRVAFHTCDSVGPRNDSFAAQWLACALPYRRFARTLAGACARLGADAVRYSFIVADFHHLLLAGFTGAPAVGSLTSLTASRPAMRAASLVALRWLSLK